jgi:hypothetical protein
MQQIKNADFNEWKKIDFWLSRAKNPKCFCLKLAYKMWYYFSPFFYQVGQKSILSSSPSGAICFLRSTEVFLASRGQFHQHFMSAFAPLFLRYTKFKLKM